MTADRRLAPRCLADHGARGSGKAIERLAGIEALGHALEEHIDHRVPNFPPGLFERPTRPVARSRKRPDECVPAGLDDPPSRRSTGSRPARGPSGWFPRSLSNRLTGEVPSYAPAASPRVRRRPSPWPPRPATWTDRGVLRATARMRAAAQPRSVRFRAGSGSLERRSIAGSSRTPSRLACRTRTIWQCWPVPALSGLLTTLAHVSGFRLPPASPTRCDGPLAVLVPSPHG